MYRNLNSQPLGVSGRQSELIELALTYGFKGMSTDVDVLVRRAEKTDVEHSCRFFKSANLKIGSFELPFTWAGSEEDYQAGLTQLDAIGQIAQELEAKACVTWVQPASDALPYHENFEMHRQRLGEIADRLGKVGVQLGLGFRADKEAREGQFQFIFQSDDLLTLIKTIGSPHAGLWLDSWHWKVGGGTIEQLSELEGHQVVAVDLADIPPEADLGEITVDQRTLPQDGGVVDCQSIINLLRDKKYDGAATVSPHASSMAGRTRDGVIQAVNDVFDRLWQQAGFVVVGGAAEETAAEEPKAEEAAPASDSATDSATDTVEAAKTA